MGQFIKRGKIKLPINDKRICAVCGKPFIPNAKGRPSICCSSACKEKRKVQTDKKSSLKSTVNTYEIKCEVCGKVFIAGYSFAKYCSNACKKRGHANKSIEYHKEHYSSTKNEAKAKTKSAKKKKAATIGELAVEARKHGMTYGKYIAMIEGGAYGN